MENCFLGRGRTRLCNTFLCFFPPFSYSTFPGFLFQLFPKVPFSCRVVTSTCPTCTVAENTVFPTPSKFDSRSQWLPNDCFPFCRRVSKDLAAERNGMNANETKMLAVALHSGAVDALGTPLLVVSRMVNISAGQRPTQAHVEPSKNL